MPDETQPEATAETPAPRMIERATFDRVVQAKTSLEAQLTEERAKIQALEERVSSVDALTQQLAKANEEKAELTSRFGRFQTIASATGTTDEDVIEAVAWQHSRLPADGRPELAEWIGALKEDPSRAPVLLRPLFAAPAEPATAKTPPAKPKALPGAGAQQAAAAPAGASQAEIRAETARALQTGDYSRLQALMRPPKG